MKNLEENIARMEQELAEMKAKLKENKPKYPIYCKSKNTGLIVKFDGLQGGVVVKQSVDYNVGDKIIIWAKHTDTTSWQQLEVDETTGFYDTQPVWCWDNHDTHEFHLKFYDAKNKSTFRYDGNRNGLVFDNYSPFECNWTNLMLNAHKTLEL